MLTALLISYLLGSGSFEPLFDKQTRAAIKQVISETDRQQEVLSIVKNLEKSRDNAVKAGKRGPRKALDRLEADRTSSIEEITAEIDEIIRLRVGFQDQFIDGIFEMRDKMSETEWKAVFGSGS